MLFTGWGNPALPRSLDEVVDWMKKFEFDHAPVPEWTYALFDALLKFRDKCEVLSSRFRAFTQSRAIFFPSDIDASGTNLDFLGVRSIHPLKFHCDRGLSHARQSNVWVRDYD